MGCGSATQWLTSADVATPVVSAKLAYDCLNSVALHAPQAEELVEAMLPFLQWQTGQWIARECTQNTDAFMQTSPTSETPLQDTQSQQWTSWLASTRCWRISRA